MALRQNFAEIYEIKSIPEDILYKQGQANLVKLPTCHLAHKTLILHISNHVIKVYRM